MAITVYRLTKSSCEMDYKDFGKSRYYQGITFDVSIKHGGNLVDNYEDFDTLEKAQEEIKKRECYFYECIEWLLEHLNDRFYDRDEDYLKVCFERYFLNTSVSNVKKKFNIHNDRYYVIMKNAEYLAKRGWLLSPPKALTDLVLYGSIEHCKSFYKS